MDRRAFLRDAGALALGSACQPYSLRFAFAGRVPDASAPLSAATGAVFDPSLARGLELAREAARAGCVAWSTGDRAHDLAIGDISELWHARMARHVEQGAMLIGALRPSDRFVLARLAMARGVTLLDFASPGRPALARSDSRDCARRT